MNTWVGMGRLTADPKAIESKDVTIARFTLAVDRRAKNGTADFISCVAFGTTADFIKKWCFKGTKVVASGRIQTGSYEDKDGKKVYTTDVVIEQVEFAESKKAAEESRDDDGLPFV